MRKREEECGCENGKMEKVRVEEREREEEGKREKRDKNVRKKEMRAE